MEKTLLVRGLALFSTLIGIQQWMAQNVDFQVFIILLLITAFLLAVESDYGKNKSGAGESAEEMNNGEHAFNHNPPKSSFQYKALITLE